LLDRVEVEVRRHKRDLGTRGSLLLSMQCDTRRNVERLLR
jgi:hypothetical protein